MKEGRESAAERAAQPELATVSQKERARRTAMVAASWKMASAAARVSEQLTG
jgi:hypothetical protein